MNTREKNEAEYGYEMIKRFLKQKGLDESLIKFFIKDVLYTLPQIKRVLEAHAGEEKKKQYILLSAIWVKDSSTNVHQPKNVDSGFVVYGRRHHNCYAVMQALDKDVRKRFAGVEMVGGFLTNDDMFVTRAEAQVIAEEAGQVEKDLIGSVLTSEDLW